MSIYSNVIKYDTNGEPYEEYTMDCDCLHSKKRCRCCNYTGIVTCRQSIPPDLVKYFKKQDSKL